MKMIKFFTALFAFCVTIGVAQEDNSLTRETLPLVINIENTDAVNNFREMDLDSFYTNLLDPQQVSGNEREEVIRSWGDFHRKITKYLKEAQFDWKSDEPTVRVINRIYFDKDGAVNYYVFKITNPEIDEQTKQEFHRVLNKFVAENKIDYSKNTVFAQCGPVEYTVAKH